MPAKRHKPHELIGTLREVEIVLSQGRTATSHHRIDSTTGRAHVSAAGGKRGLIEALSAACGTG